MNLTAPGTIEALTNQVGFPSLWVWVTKLSEPFFVGLLLALFAVFLFRRTKDYWNVPGHITLSLTLAIPLNYLLRYLIQQPRPFMDGMFEPLVYHEANFGFPSNHAAATAVFTVVFLWFGYRGIGGAIAVATLLVGGARVLTGIHYPVDILGGWIVGGGVSAPVCYYGLARLAYAPEPVKTLLRVESSHQSRDPSTDSP